MQVSVNQRSLDVFASYSELLAGGEIVVLAAAAVVLAGSALGALVIGAVIFTALLIHSAFRNV